MLFKKNKYRRVYLPKESKLTPFHFKSVSTDESISKGIVDLAYKDLEYKDIFPWHLFIKAETKELDEFEFPNESFQEKVKQYNDRLDSLFNSKNEKPTALFIATQFQKGESYILWQIHEPDSINAILQNEIDHKSFIFNFEYRMENDPKWEAVSDLLS